MLLCRQGFISPLSCHSMDSDASLQLLDRLSSAADKVSDSAIEADCREHEDLLALAHSRLDPSTPSGQVTPLHAVSFPTRIEKNNTQVNLTDVLMTEFDFTQISCGVILAWYNYRSPACL